MLAVQNKSKEMDWRSWLGVHELFRYVSTNAHENFVSDGGHGFDIKTVDTSEP